jgi:hypothetical protein
MTTKLTHDVVTGMQFYIHFILQYPESSIYRVRGCLHALSNEERWNFSYHRFKGGAAGRAAIRIKDMGER